MFIDQLLTTGNTSQCEPKVTIIRVSFG